jgi:hypothetical protein
VKFKTFLFCVSVGGCQEASLVVQVIAADGGDPFLPPDAATQARFRFEDNRAAPVTVNVAPNGYFSLELTTPPAALATRGIVESLQLGTVTGSGASPPVKWSALGAAYVSVFVQRNDTLVHFPWSLTVQRTSPILLAIEPNFVVALGGTTTAAASESFNLLTLTSANNGSTIESAFGRNTSAVRLANNTYLLFNGCMSIVWNPLLNTNPMMPASMPPTERCAIHGSTVVQEPTGGALVFGGHNASGPVARVDLIDPDGQWMTAPPMSAPRDRISTVRIGPYDVLLAGGQPTATPLLERYTRTPGVTSGALQTGMTRVDERSGVALVDVGEGVVLALGGNVLGSTDLVAEDVVIDTRCLSVRCPLVLGTPVLLRERRREPVAVVAEGGRVVVASGTGSAGVAASVETVDISNLRAPVMGQVVGNVPFENITGLRLNTGSVMLMGGGTRDVWVYRH